VEDVVTVNLQTQEISKRYDSFTALEPSTFALNSAQITILSGPNGSGKTTLLSCLSGIIQPTTGSISVGGYDLFSSEVEARKRLAFVPDVPRFYLELTAWEHLRFIAMANQALEGFENRAEDILRKLGLWKVRHHFPHHYSRGMRLKLGLALAFIRPFEVLLLDEPTSALDQDAVGTLIKELEALRSREVSVLLSTHDPNLLKQIGDRQLVISDGRVEEQ